MRAWSTAPLLASCASDKAPADTATPLDAEAELLIWTTGGDRVVLDLPVTLDGEDPLTLSGAQADVAFENADRTADVSFTVTIDPIDDAFSWTGDGAVPGGLSASVLLDGADVTGGGDTLSEASWGTTARGHAGRMVWLVEDEPWYEVSLDLGVGPQTPVRWFCRSAYSCQEIELPAYRSDAATAEATCTYNIYAENPWLDVDTGTCPLEDALSVCIVSDEETRVLYPGWCDLELVREAVELDGAETRDLLEAECPGEVDIRSDCP
jgi:hypothetical protein